MCGQPGGSTGARNQTLGALLWLAIEQRGLPLKLFDSSAGFLLADGSVRSPDASVVQLERWQALSEAERNTRAQAARSGCADLPILYSNTNMWFADPRTDGTIVTQLLETLCCH